MEYLGIDLDGEKASFALLDNKLNIKDLSTYSIASLITKKSNVKRLYIYQKEKRNSFVIVTALSSNDVLLKTVPFKSTKKSFLKKTIKIYTEQYLSSTPTALIAHLFSKKESILRFFLTTNELLTKQIKRFIHIQLEPDVVTTTSLALCSFANYYIKSEKDLILLNIGYNKSSAVLMTNNLPTASYKLKWGTSKLIANPEEDAEHTDLNKLNKKNINFDCFQKLKNEVNKTLQAILKKGNRESYKILITGSLKGLENIGSFLISNENLSLVEEEESIKTLKLKEYAIPIGLAISQANKKESPIQFLNNEFTPKRSLRSFAMKSFILLGFTILLFASLNIISLSYFEIKGNELKKSISQLIELEQQFINSKSLNIDTSQNLDELLSTLENKIERESRTSPFELTVPNVTNVLEWLNNHDILKGNSEIINIKYDLVQYPKIENFKSPYKAKVELQIKIPSSTIARQFHDILIKGDELADQNAELTWDVADDFYTTSFYLKPITTNY